MATTPGKDNKKTGSKDVNKGPTGIGSAKDQGKGPGKDQESKDSAQTPLTPELYEGVLAELKTANEANIKLSEDFTKLEEKKAKAEKYIVELKEELKDARGLVKALRTEMVKGPEDKGYQKPDQSLPGHASITTEKKPEAGAVPDGICGLLTCKQKFNVEDGIIKDQTSRAYLSTRCPFCGKIQNAENARLRFAEAR